MKTMLPPWIRGAALLALTLAAGVILGVSYERRRASSHQAVGAHHLIERLHNELELDQAQTTAIAAILARRQTALDSTWHLVQPRVHATLDSTQREIVGILRPEQAMKFRRLMDSRHADRRHEPPRK